MRIMMMKQAAGPKSFRARMYKVAAGEAEAKAQMNRSSSQAAAARPAFSKQQPGPVAEKQVASLGVFSFRISILERRIAYGFRKEKWLFNKFVY